MAAGSEDHASSGDRVRHLGRRLSAVQDPLLHVSIIAEHFAEGAGSDLARDLDWLIARAIRDPFAQLYDSFVYYLLSTENGGAHYAAAERVYRAAREEGRDGVAKMFLDPPPQRAVTGWTGDADPALLDATLGERKALARRPDRLLLDRILRVPEPDVIRILLANPRLRAQDAVWLAARRPNTAAVLHEVSIAPRWRVQPAVRVALVNNPYAPPRTSVLLCPLLRTPELREVTNDAGLHPLVRTMARHVLDARAPEAEDGADIVPFPSRS